MRLLMLATGPFAAPTFRRLYDGPHTVEVLVTAPRRSQHGKPAPLSAVREIALERATPIIDPEDVTTAAAREQLAAYRPDLLVVCDYGQILSPAALATARLGGINLHASLLPKYRGAAPINWAIYHGDAATGVTVIHMAPQVDAGPCLAQASTPIRPDETAVELEVRLAEIGAWLVHRTIDTLEAGRLEALPQTPGLATRAPRLKKTDGAIDWRRPALAIKNQVRAMEPWPKTYTYWHRPDGPPLRLILGPLAVVVGDAAPARPGEVLQATADRLVIAAGSDTVQSNTVQNNTVQSNAVQSDAVQPVSLQPAGKRMLSVREFLHGYRVRPGDLFGPEQ